MYFGKRIIISKLPPNQIIHSLKNPPKFWSRYCLYKYYGKFIKTHFKIYHPSYHKDVRTIFYPIMIGKISEDENKTIISIYLGMSFVGGLLFIFLLLISILGIYIAINVNDMTGMFYAVVITLANIIFYMDFRQNCQLLLSDIQNIINL